MIILLVQVNCAEDEIPFTKETSRKIEAINKLVFDFILFFDKRISTLEYDISSGLMNISACDAQIARLDAHISKLNIWREQESLKHDGLKQKIEL